MIDINNGLWSLKLITLSIYEPLMHVYDFIDLEVKQRSSLHV